MTAENRMTMITNTDHYVTEHSGVHVTEPAHSLVHVNDQNMSTRIHGHTHGRFFTNWFEREKEKGGIEVRDMIGERGT